VRHARHAEEHQNALQRAQLPAPDVSKGSTACPCAACSRYFNASSVFALGHTAGEASPTPSFHRTRSGGGPRSRSRRTHFRCTRAGKQYQLDLLVGPSDAASDCASERAGALLESRDAYAGAIRGCPPGHPSDMLCAERNGVRARGMRGETPGARTHIVHRVFAGRRSHGPIFVRDKG